MASSIQIWRMLVIGFGFSYGCDELALNGPPPFSPISLIASWLAIGPPGITCSWPVTVHAGGIERKRPLDAQLDVEHQHGRQAETQQREGVHAPPLLALRVHAAQPVDQALDRQKHTVARRGPAAVHLGHVTAEQRR